ncbi:hypothetical protein PTI98_012338 [Pleurotus ostreatus]|nr:hypothetical protein PTI98_012338 [Pleurotus ostreatus]
MTFTLSPETWIHVFEYLNQSELAPMLYISHSMKGSVEAVLYKEVEIVDARTGAGISHFVDQSHRTITKEDGRLAGVVRTLPHSMASSHAGATPRRSTLNRCPLLSLRNLKYLDVFYHGVVLMPPVVDATCQITSTTRLSYPSIVKDPIPFADFLGSLPAYDARQFYTIYTPGPHRITPPLTTAVRLI